jgi:tetratricopeptide (TPR) repeat protein
MEEGTPPQDLGIGAPLEPVEELDPRALNRELKDLLHLWSTEGDSERLWEQVHDILIKLQRAGDIDPLMKQARKAKKALKPKGSASDLAMAALSLWVLERYDEAETVLRASIQRLPRNRYPWSLMLRHLSWDRDPRDAIVFVRDSLGTVTWRSYALVQLGTICIDAASRSYKAEDLDTCDKYLGEARSYLKEACDQEGCTDDMRRTADRLTLLVDTLEKRSETARSVQVGDLPESDRVYDGEAQMVHDMVKVAEASGVSLEGEPDDQLDLDELERAARLEMPDDDQDETYQVLEVTPQDGIGLIRKKARKE